MIEQRLQVTLATIEGGADACLHLGPKITERLVAKLYFANNGYEFTLLPTADNRLVFSDEATVFFGNLGKDRSSLGSGHFEAKLKDHKDDPGKWGASRGIPSYVFDAISSWVVYHFHDTSLNAGVRRPRALNDNVSLPLYRRESRTLLVPDTANESGELHEDQGRRATRRSIL